MAIEKALVKVELINVDEGVRITSWGAKFNAYRLILYPKKTEEFPIIQRQTQVDIIAYFEDGIQLMWGEISLSLPGQMNVEVLSSLSEKKERRKNLKVRTSFDAKVVAMKSLGKRKRRMRIDANIRVRDLSMGGLGFFSSNLFFRNQLILIDLGYLKPGFIVEYVVLRRERITGYGGFSPGFKYKYGGMVIQLSGEQERMVCEYVYKVQITDYQRRKENNPSRS